MLSLGRKIGTSVLLEVLDVKMTLTVKDIDSYKAYISICATDREQNVAPDIGVHATLGQNECIHLSIENIRIRIEVAYFRFREVVLSFDCPDEVLIVRTDALVKQAVTEGKKYAGSH